MLWKVKVILGFQRAVAPEPILHGCWWASLANSEFYKLIDPILICVTYADLGQLG